MKIHITRIELKKIDFWIRYLYPNEYRKLNAPLPVEWETEVFEKFEKPHKREGAGLMLAELNLTAPSIDPSEILNTLQPGLEILSRFHTDSVRSRIQSPVNFFYANRLFLLNAAAIYTTGFECPESSRILPEFNAMVDAVSEYQALFQTDNSEYLIDSDYISLFNEMKIFLKYSQDSIEHFDHYTLIRDYINPLFSLNQKAIRKYDLASSNLIDFSLNDQASSIFSKDLFFAQNSSGIFNLSAGSINHELRETGEMLFFDPILSGNGKRSCASCHHPNMFFTDTTVSTPASYNQIGRLSRNAPSLLNILQNHLLMQDGQFYQTEDQILSVICNPLEMGGNQKDILKNVMSCDDYRRRFKRLSALTPAYPEPTQRHIIGAIIYYLHSLNHATSSFDDAMNKKTDVNTEVQSGFNLFMGKAQCATCHFVPAFNGVKPPYVSSEFEVLGTPKDSSVSELSPDSGRYKIAPSPEMLHAFRTSTVRNVTKTKPYMHNGAFNTLQEVITFYNNGGGVGHGLHVDNQTLSSDSLHLTEREMNLLIIFLESLAEKNAAILPPNKLPKSKNDLYKHRQVGGEY